VAKRCELAVNNGFFVFDIQQQCSVDRHGPDLSPVKHVRILREIQLNTAPQNTK